MPFAANMRDHYRKLLRNSTRTIPTVLHCSSNCSALFVTVARLLSFLVPESGILLHS